MCKKLAFLLILVRLCIYTRTAYNISLYVHPDELFIVNIFRICICDTRKQIIKNIKTFFLFFLIGQKRDLLRLLNPIAYNWRQLGEALGIKYGDLESILNNRCRDTDRLSDVLQLWFDEQPSKVTWQTIITAVELPPVNNLSVADNMCKYLSD